MFASLRFANWRRHIIPFTLVFRLVSLTTSSGLAIAAEIPSVHGQSTYYAQVFSPEAFLEKTNVERTALGLPALTLNKSLDEAAMDKAIDMATVGYWDHFRPSDQKAPWDFIKENGYTYKVAGENLARGFVTVQGITAAWMQSPAHRANLLSIKYTEVGYASIRSTNPETGERVLLTVQMFGSR